MSRRRHSIAAAALLSLALLPALAAPADAVKPGPVKSGPLTWSKPKLVDPLRGGFASVSCVSKTFCLAGDEHGKVLRYDGRKWTTQAVVGDGSSAVRFMTCVTTTFCVAALESSQTSRLVTYHGAGWHLGPRLVLPTGIDCVSARFCLAVTFSGSYARYDGTWHHAREFTAKSVDVGDVSCASTTFCIAVARGGQVYRYNGSSWSSGHALRQVGHLSAVSCPTSKWCLAIDNRGRSVRLSGGHWHWARRTELGAGENALDCVAPRRCVGVGGALVQVYLHGAWHAAHPIVTSELADVSCSARRFCVAVSSLGEAAARTADGWQHRARPDPAVGGKARQVSCASAHSCVVIDQSDAWLRFDGSSWTTPKRITYRDVVPFRIRNSLSCPSPSFCMADFGMDRTRVLSGDDWAPPVRTGHHWGAVSCESAQSCVLIDQRTAMVWDGSSWHVGYQTNGGDLTGVSCTRTFCLAVKYGSVLTYRDGQFSAPVQVVADRGRSAVGIACARGPFCMAYVIRGVHAGESFKRVHGRWTSAGSAFRGDIPGPVPLVRLMSCINRSLCVTSRWNAVSTYDGHGWTAPTAIAKHHLSGISCARPLCVAETYRGRTLIGRVH